MEHSANGLPHSPIPADLVSANTLAVAVIADQVMRVTF